MRRRTVHVAAVLAGLPAAAGAWAGPLGALGAMGDSLTDEYDEEIAPYADNWLQQLVLYRGIDVGPAAGQAGQPGGTWGEPRRTGYEYDWARVGADSGDLLSQGQDLGLAGQVILGDVTHAVLAIGANDFNPTTSPYINIYFGFWGRSQINNHVAMILANIETALETMAATDADVVLVNLLDFGIVPAVWGTFPYTNANNRQRVADAVQQVNEGLIPLARQYGVPLVDAYAFAETVFGTHHDLQEFLVVGNVTIELWESDTTSNTNPQAGFVDDGAHPHTHLQGILANVVAQALNAGYDAGIELFSEAQILDHAGLVYGGLDTLAAQIGTYGDYVYNFAVPGDVNGDGVIGVDDFLGVLAAWGACPGLPDPCLADTDGDGDVDVDDFLAVLAGWG